MSYELYDFAETLSGQGLKPQDVAKVHAAWGEQGDYAEWEGGFLVELKDSRFAYISGWCDTTGWGCQDGTDIQWFETLPDRGQFKRAYGDQSLEWDDEPVDLNRFVRGEIDRWDEPV
jgi:hypothetical protein